MATTIHPQVLSEFAAQTVTERTDELFRQGMTQAQAIDAIGKARAARAAQLVEGGMNPTEALAAAEAEPLRDPGRGEALVLIARSQNLARQAAQPYGFNRPPRKP